MKPILMRLLTIIVLIITANAQIAVAQQTETSHGAARTGPPQDEGVQQPASPTLSLQQIITEALKVNPEIASMARGVDVLESRIPQQKALPDPTLSFGSMGNIVPIPPFDIQKGDPSSARTISFSQEIPFPGKLALKSKMAAMDAASQQWEYEQARLNLIAEVKDAYFEYFYLVKAIEVVGKNKDLLEKFEKIAEARYTVGKGIQQDVLKAQVEVSKLIDQLATLDQRKQVAQARLNSLLFRDPESPLLPPAEVKPQSFDYTLGQLREMAMAYYPGLKAQKRRIDRDQYGIQLAQKDYYPDFSVGFTYFNRPGIPEMYGFNVGVKIPLYFWQKQRPAVAEATASKVMEVKRLESITSLLYFKIQDRYLAAITSDKLVKLYGTTIIPQSSLALESAISGYEVGRVDFLTLLDNLVTLRGYELSYYQQLSDREKAIAALEPFVGRPLRP